MSNIIKDFTSFARSKFGYGTAERIGDMVNGRGGFKNYISPTILEEHELHCSQMDIFSRLMKDRIIFLGSEIDDQCSNVIVSQLLYLDQSDPGRDVTLYINSGGGGIYAGYGIIDTAQYITSDVSTICTSLAASMAAVILSCGTKGKRKALPRSRVMIHQPLQYGGGRGATQASDLEISTREILKLRKELYEILSEQSGQSIDKIQKDAERDFWMTAKEALDYGLIDEIITKKTK